MDEDDGPAGALTQRVAAMSLAEPVDVRRAGTDRQIPLFTSDECASALGALGRTEDIAVSPDGALIVVAGFESNHLTLVRHRIANDSVEVTNVRSVAVDGLLRPHGLDFVDDETLLVANRESELSVVRLDERRQAVRSSAVLIDGSAEVPVRTPGSVAVRQLGDDLVEVFVCNNYAHDVTRYLLDGRRDWSIVDGELLLAADLDIPDGVAVSADGRWIAISNHNRHAIYLYRYDVGLVADGPPAGVLRGVNYPHGVAFADGDRQLLVADAGLPCLSTFEAPDGDWSGERTPWRIDRVMDERNFHVGRYNPQEGGPKGLAVVCGHMVAVTSEFQPLAFFGLDERPAPVEGGSTPAALTDRGVRTPMLRLAHRRRAATHDAERAATERDLAKSERDEVVRERDEVVRERDEVVCERDEAVRERDELRGACSTLEHDVDHLRVELEAAGARHADATVEINRLIERVGVLESHIDAMHATRSWRWSAPLRGCSLLARRLRQVGR